MMRKDFSYLKSSVDNKDAATTAQIIEELHGYRATWKKILSGEMQRGRDYWGGFDDSIANDMHTCQLALGYRALVNYDKEAHKALDAEDWQAVASELLNMIRISLQDNHTENLEWLRYEDDSEDDEL